MCVVYIWTNNCSGLATPRPWAQVQQAPCTQWCWSTGRWRKRRGHLPASELPLLVLWASQRVPGCVSAFVLGGSMALLPSHVKNHFPIGQLPHSALSGAQLACPVLNRGSEARLAFGRSSCSRLPQAEAYRRLQCLSPLSGFEGGLGR